MKFLQYLTQKCQTFDHGIGLVIDTPFFHLIFTNFMENFKLLVKF
jgi:hypothetical protein